MQNFRAYTNFELPLTIAGLLNQTDMQLITSGLLCIKFYLKEHLIISNITVAHQLSHSPSKLLVTKYFITPLLNAMSSDCLICRMEKQL